MESNALIMFSSGLMGAAAFMLLRPFIDNFFSEDHLEYESWNRQQLRCLKLRNNSSPFRVMERWIRGLARLIERYANWLVQPRKAGTSLQRFVDLGLASVFGSPRVINEAVRVRASEQPWLVSELVAAGIIIGGVAFFSVGIILYGMLSPVKLGVLCICCLLFGYRLWIRSFVQRARERQFAIRQMIPHTIDMIAMIMQSGGTFLSGIEAIIADFPSHPLSEEFLLLKGRLERGQSMGEAVDATASTINLAEFDEVARVLNRIHEHGAPSSESFLRLAKQMRLTHLRKMEERVGQAESKMQFPTVMVLISCILVCVGPLILSMIESGALDF